MIKYKTGNLPPNFIALGVMLFAIGIWRMIIFDWIGVLLFAMAVILLFIKSGVIIDAENKRLKKYIGFFAIRKGEWKDIKSLLNLLIVETKKTQTMNVLSISRTATNNVCKLFMILPDDKIEIMSGKKDVILKRAEKISSMLQISVDDETR